MMEEATATNRLTVAGGGGTYEASASFDLWCLRLLLLNSSQLLGRDSNTSMLLVKIRKKIILFLDKVNCVGKMQFRGIKCTLVWI